MAGHREPLFAGKRLTMMLYDILAFRSTGIERFS